MAECESTEIGTSALWLRMRFQAAKRKAVAARFTTWRVPRLRTLPPLTRLSGQRRSHEAKFFSVLSGTHQGLRPTKGL